MNNNITSLELFAQRAKIQTSQNIIETLEKIQNARESYVDLFKNLCLSNSTNPGNMLIENYQSNINHYPKPGKNDNGFQFIDLPFNKHINYSTKKFQIYENAKQRIMSLVSTIQVKDWGFNEEWIKSQITKDDHNYNFWIGLKKLFGFKTLFPKVKYSFDIKYEEVYYIEAFEIKKIITKEEYELLGFFFEEQRLKKILDNQLLKLEEFKNKHFPNETENDLGTSDFVSSILS